jgi:hypothetical protein
MNELILKLSKKYFVKQITNDQLCIITSYKSDLNDIPRMYNLILLHTFEQSFSVQGVFKLL